MLTALFCSSLHYFINQNDSILPDYLWYLELLFCHTNYSAFPPLFDEPLRNEIACLPFDIYYIIYIQKPSMLPSLFHIKIYFDSRTPSAEGVSIVCTSMIPFPQSDECWHGYKYVLFGFSTLFQLYHADISLIHDPWLNNPVLC